MPTVEEVIGKYVELRDRKAELVKKQAEETRPLNEAMEHMENWLAHQMNEVGCNSFKTDAGTAFKVNSNSVQMQDPAAFKDFVFAPVLQAVINYLTSSGYAIRDVDSPVISNIIRDLPMWDMVDFRAGKKGIVDYTTNEQKPVPGVAVNTTTSINIRRA